MYNAQLGFSIITPTNKVNSIQSILANYNNQILKNKELIIIINNDNIDINKFRIYIEGKPNIRIYKLPEIITLGECLNFGIEKSKYSWIARFDDDDYYGPGYLLQAANILRSDKYKIVGKSTNYYYLEEFRELGILKKYENGLVDWISGGTICFNKEIFDIIKFRDLNYEEDYYFLKDAKENGINIYSTSRKNFIIFRSKNINDHTWKIESYEIRDIYELVKSNISFKESFKFINR